MKIFGPNGGELVFAAGYPDGTPASTPGIQGRVSEEEQEANELIDGALRYFDERDPAFLGDRLMAPATMFRGAGDDQYQWNGFVMSKDGMFGFFEESDCLAEDASDGDPVIYRLSDLRGCKVRIPESIHIPPGHGHIDFSDPSREFNAKLIFGAELSVMQFAVLFSQLEEGMKEEAAGLIQQLLRLFEKALSLQDSRDNRPERGNLVPVGPATMNTARVDHTATLLPDGTVLVAGGKGESVLSSSELYNPATGFWRTTASMNIPRWLHTATLLPNGMVLVIGGCTDRGWDGVATVELYDPARGTWSMTSSLVTARAGHSATLLPSGLVLIAGGWSLTVSSVASAELYDPATGTSSMTASMAAARAEHSATLLPNGTVLVCGGCADYNMPYSAELFDPATGTWSTTESMAVVRSSHTATLLPNGTVLVPGGSGNGPVTTAEVYDPRSGAWSMTASMGVARADHRATLMPDGTVLVSGGATVRTIGQSGTDDRVSSSELFDPVTGLWSLVPSVGGIRSGHTATLLPNGAVLIAGGQDGDSREIVASVDIYG
jgi:hypothetical protein